MVLTIDAYHESKQDTDTPYRKYPSPVYIVNRFEQVTGGRIDASDGANPDYVTYRTVLHRPATLIIEVARPRRGPAPEKLRPPDVTSAAVRGARTIRGPALGH